MAKRHPAQYSRRDLFRAGSMATAAGFWGAVPAAPATLPTRGDGPEVYTRIGVRPFVNCTSTYTINGGSAQLPEVIEAVHQASYYHVNLDELMAKVGARIAELLGGEAAMVSSGAAGAVTCGTAACVAGGDPEKMQQLPDTRGLKNEVVVPRWSRSGYDHAVRNVGMTMVEVDTLEDLEKAFGPRTAMAHSQVNILSDGNKFSARQFVEACHQRGVPILVDAAADLPLRPNPFLSLGVDLVAYSCGKILRGPQTAGILLGRKDLVTAAYACSSPHITFARAIKVSKEEIVGALVAVETLVRKRDRDAEDREWKSWYRHIIDRTSKISGLRAEIVESPLPSYYPVLKLEWDPQKIGLTAGEVGEKLLDGEPRIMTHAEGEGHSFVVRPAAMYPGEYKIVAERLYEVFSKAPGAKPKPKPAPPSVDVSGRWDVDIRFVASSTRYKLYLDANGNRLSGVCSSPVIEQGQVSGSIDGANVEIRTAGRYEAASFNYKFTGTVHGDQMSGEVELGDEYGKARWTARRRA